MALPPPCILSPPCILYLVSSHPIDPFAGSAVVTAPPPGFFIVLSGLVRCVIATPGTHARDHGGGGRQGVEASGTDVAGEMFLLGMGGAGGVLASAIGRAVPGGWEGRGHGCNHRMHGLDCGAYTSIAAYPCIYALGKCVARSCMVWCPLHPGHCTSVAFRRH